MGHKPGIAGIEDLLKGMFAYIFKMLIIGRLWLHVLSYFDEQVLQLVSKELILLLGGHEHPIGTPSIV